MIPSSQKNLKRILVLGVGGSGCSCVANYSKLNKSLSYMLVDSDEASLSNFNSDNIFLIGKKLTLGGSTGGDVEIGRQVIEKDASKLRVILEVVDLVIIIGGLGGGLASGAIPVITRIAKECLTRSIVLSTFPYSFEGKNRINIAKDSVKRIRSHADVVIKLHNDKLKKRINENRYEQSFKESHFYFENAINSIWIISNKPGICGLDYSSLQTIIKFCDGFCHYVHARCVEDCNRSKKIINDLKNHPLTSKGLILKDAPGAIILIRGDKNLKLLEIEEIMNFLNDEFIDNAWINFGIQHDKSIDGIFVDVFVAETWNEPLINDSSNIFDSQRELSLSNDNKGVFSEMEPTVHKNQDLDIPTYRRKNIKLPK